MIQASGAQGDAASNAVVILDAFSHLLQAEIEGDLDSLSDLFGSNPPLPPLPIGGRGEE